MKATFQINDPLSVPMTLMLTMPLRDWQRIQSQLSTAYPSWKLSNVIVEMVSRAAKTFSESTELDL